jgi:hypothetical protein
MKTKEPYIEKYRIVEFIPNRFIIERSKPEYAFWSNKIIGETWYKPEETLYYLTSYKSIELAVEAIETMIERNGFVPRVVKEYVAEAK